jgi:hypothetical protein
MEMGRGKDKVAQILKAHGLGLKEFTRHEKRRGKTPDFRVFKSENLAFFCEVKSAQEDSWLDEKFQQSPSIEIVGGLRPDPVFNRLTSHIHKASKQFSAVNPNLIYPNVLAFINFDSMSGFLDLIGVITGSALAESGESYPIYLQYSEGRIKDEKFRIHLYLWIDEYKANRMLFNVYDGRHIDSLCDCFGIDPSTIGTGFAWWVMSVPILEGLEGNEE